MNTAETTVKDIFVKGHKDISSMELSKFRKSINVDWDVKDWISEGPYHCFANMVGIDDEGFDWIGVGVFNVVKETDTLLDVEFSFALDSTCPEDEAFGFDTLELA